MTALFSSSHNQPTTWRSPDGGDTMPADQLVVGIDASRNRSGGAKAHLIGILTEGEPPAAYGIRRVHLWAYRSLMSAIPDYPWLVKYSPPVLEKSLLLQAWWQYWRLPREVRASKCDLLFNTDAASVCPYRPNVTMMRDMLSYEPGEMERFGMSKARLRLLLKRVVQDRSMRNAQRVVFLTNYAARVTQQTIGALDNAIVIPHGVGQEFRLDRPHLSDASASEILFLYVSNASMYKHQWQVIRAVGRLRRSGVAARLLLVGGGEGRAQELLDQEISVTDPNGEFVEQRPFVPHGAIPRLLADADVFVFASSCESMPNTLLEAMAIGLPIACSDRGPMPEILGDGGVYFDPENSDSIAAALESIIRSPALKERIAKRAKELSAQYSWARCSRETWKTLSECARNARSVSGGKLK